MGGTDEVGKSCEIFSIERTQELLQTLRVTVSSEVFDAFRRELNEHAERWQRIIRTTPLPLPASPFDASTSQRIRWLERNVINPSNRLLDALKENHHAYFSPWAAEHEIGLPPIDEVLIEKNQRLLDYAQELKSWLEYYQSEKAGLYPELKYEIVIDIIDLVRKYFPKVTLSRGTYVPKHGQGGPTVQFLRDAYFEITGVHDPLDAPIQRCL